MKIEERTYITKSIMKNFNNLNHVWVLGTFVFTVTVFVLEVKLELTDICEYSLLKGIFTSVELLYYA